MRLNRLLVPAALAVAACRGAAARGAQLACAPPAAAHWLPDSSAALCLPGGFVSRGPHGFARPRGDTLPEHWLAVSVDRGPALRDGEPWPLTLASGVACLADCATAEDVTRSRTTTAGVPAYVERGLVSGGFAGEVRVPALVASLDGRPSWTAVVHVRTPATRMRDSLAAAVGTLRVYPAAVRD